MLRKQKFYKCHNLRIRIFNCGVLFAVQQPGVKNCIMVCRMRQYGGLNSGFTVTEKAVTYKPFLLKLSLKDNTEDDGKIVYLIIQATPIYSPYKCKYF